MPKSIPMSHIVSIQTQVQDVEAIRGACRQLELRAPVHGARRLYSGTAKGWVVQLPDWRYPLVCDTDSATIHYDNFEGRWGDPQQLDRFLQAYAVEKATLEARRQGHSVLEQPLQDGSIRLTLTLGNIT
jgi:hypothetical protein